MNCCCTFKKNQVKRRLIGELTIKLEKSGNRKASKEVKMTQVNKLMPNIRLSPCATPKIY